MASKTSVPFASLKLPGMAAPIQQAQQPHAGLVRHGVAFVPIAGQPGQQVAPQARSTGAAPSMSCRSSQDRSPLAQHQAQMATIAQRLNPAQQPAGWRPGVVPMSKPPNANQQNNTGLSGAKGIKSAPAASTAFRRSALNFWKA